MCNKPVCEVGPVGVGINNHKETFTPWERNGKARCGVLQCPQEYSTLFNRVWLVVGARLKLRCEVGEWNEVTRPGVCGVGKEEER